MVKGSRFAQGRDGMGKDYERGQMGIGGTRRGVGRKRGKDVRRG